MCKILVISDVHGRLRDLRWVLQNETADAMFYLGDGLYDLNAALELRREPVPYPIYRVAGNCDVNYSEPSEGLAPFGGVLFFYTHGHHYGVKMGSERLAESARPSVPVSAAQMWRCSATPTGASWCAASARRPRCSTPAVCATAAATVSLRLKTANAALPGRGCLNFERERYLPARGRQHQPLGQA